VFSLGRSKAPLIGVDISSTCVKLLELTKAGNRFRVESYSVEPLPPNAIVERQITDAQLIGDAIARALKKSGTRAKTAACAVSGSAVITKIIPMPADLSEDELESQIQLEADQYIPYPLEEISLDFEVLGPSEGEPSKVDVLLAASRSDNIDIRVAALELGGLKAKIVDVEAFALENAVNHFLATSNLVEKGDTVAVVDCGAATTSLSVLRDAKVIYTREQAFGGRQLTDDIQRRYGLSYEEAGLAKRNGGLPDNYEPEVLNPFKETMALEVNRALQFFYSSSQIPTIDRIILAGGCASIPGVDMLMAAKTGVPVTLANPFSNMTLSQRVRAEGLNKDAPAMMTAFGLALRSFD
jgi:type IV pilus assembly protein PilM